MASFFFVTVSRLQFSMEGRHFAASNEMQGSSTRMLRSG